MIEDIPLGVAAIINDVDHLHSILKLGGIRDIAPYMDTLNDACGKLTDIVIKSIELNDTYRATRVN